MSYLAHLRLHWLILGLYVACGAGLVRDQWSRDVAVVNNNNVRSKDVHRASPGLVRWDKRSRTSAISYEISIKDPSGVDLIQEFQLLHSGLNSSSHAVQKRAYSRALDSCPAGEDFTRSSCQEHVSPQAYVIVCSDGLDNSWYFRRCLPNEVCIQGIPKQNPSLPSGQLVPPTSRAYCVQADNFVRIAADQLSHTTRPSFVSTKFSVPADQKVAVEAVLTGPDKTESIFAAKLEISAQTSDTSNNVQTWRSQVGGTTMCTQCARALIAPVPSKTQRIVVKAVLEATAVGGLLFLTHVAM
ncbi:MAG: hypothetical protein LQ352_000616 [Teloschistes flavicans]|nr:MAG: hypothetical protein LQ352_000616 [Teloschistes flavicans]